ncbi:MAG: ribonuclease P protein component [Candidatus Levybacteria bacterium]|nr:ribonuclease P protein component [Candidatus Levybacteria bacterium]
MRIMLAKKNRYSFKGPLPKKVLNSQSFSVRYNKNNEGLRVAVVVSKRIDKRATVRNKIKRKILETVRNNIEMNKPLDLVFYVKKNILSWETLEKEVEKSLGEIASSLRSSQ